MSSNIHCTYVSEKISKIRWRPNPIGEPHCFLTGSWDNDVNNIRLWEIKAKGLDDDIDINPFEIKELPFLGDVTELQFIDADNVVASSSEGSLYLLKIITRETEEIDLCEEVSWKGIHNLGPDFPVPCTSFSLHDRDIASVGEDGRVNLLTWNDPAPRRVIDNADSCTISCVKFLKYSELITSNARGQMKIWDLRDDCTKESNMFMLNNDNLVSATCISLNPARRHIVAAGDDQGTLTVWDLRQNSFPLNVINSHTDAVAELHFHPDRPEQLFTCSEAGDVFHWTGTAGGQAAGFGVANESVEPWFEATAATNKYEIFSLMPQLHVPVNSLDLNRDKLLCGCDNEAVYLIEHINLYN